MNIVLFTYLYAEDNNVVVTTKLPGKNFDSYMIPNNRVVIWSSTFIGGR